MYSDYCLAIFKLKDGPTRNFVYVWNMHLDSGLTGRYYSVTTIDGYHSLDFEEVSEVVLKPMFPR